MTQKLIGNVQTFFRGLLAAGQQQVQALKLANEQSRLERVRARALADLGHLAWVQQVRHPAYMVTFAQLAELRQQRQGLQAELDARQAAVQADETLRQQLSGGFAARQGDLRNQQQAASVRLSQVMGAQQQAREAPDELARLSAEQQGLQAELGAYEQRLAALAQEQEQTVGPITARLAEAQAAVKALSAQIKQLEEQQQPLFANLGAEVLAARPVEPVLANAYAAIADLDQRLVALQSQLAVLRGPAKAGADTQRPA